MQVILKLVVVLMLLISASAHANDSTASVAAGGLELLKTDDIEMVSEVLEISPRKIRVKYHFLNTSDRDIKTTVAFPMPAYGADELSGNFTPLRSFQSFVNGVRVKTNMHRVFLHYEGGDDLTSKLRNIGLTDEQIFFPLFHCSKACKISDEQYTKIAEIVQYPHGVIKETAYWEQIFPARKEIEVVHEYNHFAGAQMIRLYEEKLDRIRLDRTNLLDDPPKFEACLDDKTYQSIFRWSRRMPQQVTKLSVYYILGTGRNWKGPIKNFKLILHKEGGWVSLCFPGKPRIIDKDTIEFTQTDYVPQDELSVFFYFIGDRRGDFIDIDR